MESHNLDCHNTSASGRIAAVLKAAENDNCGAFLNICAHEAMARAAELDACADKQGTLWAVPVAVKDNICVGGVEMSCASKLLEGYVPAENAFVVDKMLAAGAVIIGKTNMDEFAMGSSGMLSAFGVVKNPCAPQCYAGGSSSGSAAAVAAGIVPLALGSDTGGSVRVPAAYCGVAAFKPTWGAVSRRGLVAHASSLDTVGIIGKSAEYCARLMAVIAGRDRGDDTSFDLDDPVSASPADMAGLRVGLWMQQMAAAGEPARRAVLRACDALRSLGAQVLELSCAASDNAAQAYIALSTAEASSCLGRFDGLRYGAGNVEPPAALRSRLLGTEVRSRLVLGSALLGMDELGSILRGARRCRADICEQMEAVFKTVDIVIGPTVTGPAPRVGEKRNARSERLADGFAAVANLAGIPALTIPCGNVEGLPLSVQLMGPRCADGRVLSAGMALEKVIGDWRDEPC